MLSLAAEGMLHIAAATGRLRERSAHDDRPDLDAFASQLAEHPGLAAEQGLGALSLSLRRDAAYAAGHGWGGTLVMVLAEHPAYAARHHLTSLIAPPAASVGRSVDTPTVGQTVPANSTPGYMEIAPNGRLAYIANREAAAAQARNGAIAAPAHPKANAARNECASVSRERIRLIPSKGLRRSSLSASRPR